MRGRRSMLLLALASEVLASPVGDLHVRYERPWEEMSDENRERLCDGWGTHDGHFLELNGSHYRPPSGYKVPDLVHVFTTHLCPSGQPLDSPIGSLDALEIVDFCRADRLMVGTVTRSFFNAYLAEPEEVVGDFGPRRILVNGPTTGKVLVAVSRPSGFWVEPLVTTWAYQMRPDATSEDVKLLRVQLCG